MENYQLSAATFVACTLFSWASKTLTMGANMHVTNTDNLTKAMLVIYIAYQPTTHHVPIVFPPEAAASVRASKFLALSFLLGFSVLFLNDKQQLFGSDH